MSSNANLSGNAVASPEELQRLIARLRAEFSAARINQRNEWREEEPALEYRRLLTLRDSESAGPGIVPPGYVVSPDASTSAFAGVQPSSQQYPAIQQRQSEQQARNDARERHLRLYGYGSERNSQLVTIAEREQQRATDQQPSSQRSQRETGAATSTGQPAAWLNTQDPAAAAAAGGPPSVTVSQDTLATYHEWIQAGQPTREQVIRGEPGSVQPPPLPPGQQQHDPFGGPDWEMPEEYRVYSSYAANDSMAPTYPPTARPWDNDDEDDEGAGQL